MDPGSAVRDVNIPQEFKDFVREKILGELSTNGPIATDESNILMTEDELVNQHVRSKLQLSEWSMHVSKELSQYFPTIPVDETLNGELEEQRKQAKLREKLTCMEGEELEIVREIFKTIEKGHLEGQAEKFKKLMEGKVKDWNFQFEEYGNTTPLLWAVLNGQRKIVQIIRDHAKAHELSKSMFYTCDKFGFRIGNLLVFSFLIVPNSRYVQAKEMIRDIRQWEKASNKPIGYINHEFAKTAPPCKIYYLLQDVFGNTSYYVDDLGHLGNYVNPLYLSVWFAPLQVVKEIIKMRLADLYLAAGNGHTIFHLAAWKGRYDILEWLQSYIRYRNMSLDVANHFDHGRQSPLHLAVISQNLECVRIFLQQTEAIKVNLRNKQGYTPVEIATALDASSETLISNKDLKLYGVTSFDTISLKYNIESFDMRSLGIMKILENDMPLTCVTKCSSILKDIISAFDSLEPETLQRDREVYVQAANTILVVATLIASASFTAYLQPPLGYILYYSSEFLVTESAAPPEAYESFVAIKQYYMVHIFWIFNSLSFFCSIATIVAGVDASLPRKKLALKEALANMRNKVVFSSYLLFLALLFVIGSFITIGFAVLPPIFKYRANMICTVAVGLVICGIALIRFFNKLEWS